MSDKYYRSAYMNLDLNAVASNFKVFSTFHPNKTVMAVVKANAYGLGSVKVIRHLMENGATFLPVATLDEAIELRMHGITAKILVLGVLPAKNLFSYNTDWPAIIRPQPSTPITPPRHTPRSPL